MKYLTLILLFTFYNALLASGHPILIELSVSKAVCLGFKIERESNDTIDITIPIIENENEYPSNVIIQLYEQGNLIFHNSVNINAELNKSGNVSIDYNKAINDVSISVLYAKEHKGKLVPSQNIYSIESINSFRKEENLGCLE